MLYLIVLSCRPDHELLKATLNLALEPDCHLLSRLRSNDFANNNHYAFGGLERLISSELMDRFQHVLAEWTNFMDAKPQRKFSEIWVILKDYVRQWPLLAARESYEVYSGVLLLAQPPDTVKRAGELDVPEGSNFIIRCPSYLNLFREKLKLHRYNPALPATLEKHFKHFTTTGLILPNWFWKGLSPLILPHNLISLPEIGVRLEHAEGIDFQGLPMKPSHLNWKDFESVNDAIMRHAAASGTELNLAELRSTVRSWNYRANIDREKFNRRNTKTDNVDSLTEQDVRRGAETTFNTKSLYLNATQLRAIWGGLVR